MPRCSISGRATIAGTATLPCVSLYATTGVRPKIVEVGIWNTTATAAVFALVRLTTAGTQGTAITAANEDDTTHTIIATGKNGHTVAPTLGAELRRADLGAAIGSGVIWTFGGLAIPSTTGDGIGIYVPTGTGQVIDFSIAWDE